MNFCFVILLLGNIIFPIVFVCKNIKKNILFDYKNLFSIGFLFYWVTPVFVGFIIESMNIEIDSSLEIWYDFYLKIEKTKTCEFLLFSFFFYLFFLKGVKLGSKKEKGLIEWEFFNKSIPVLKILLYGCILGTMFFAYYFKEFLFIDYSYINNSNIREDKGAFIGLSLIALTVNFLYLMNKRTLKEFEKSYVKNEFTITFLIISILILGLGTRLQFISSLIMFCCYYENCFYDDKFPLKKLCFCFFGILFCGFVGVMRLAELRENIIYLIFLNIFSETLFTSFSLFDFINMDNYKWVEFPIPLISSFINLLPNAFFEEEKKELIITGREIGYELYTPLGATHSFYSFMINFGILGTLIVIFIFSFLMSRLRSSRNILGRTIYIMLSGFTVFTFFRDDFKISIIKFMFQFSVLSPVLIISIMWILYKIKKYIKGKVY